MKQFGYTIVLVFGMFMLFVGLKGAVTVLRPYIRVISRSLADYLSSV